MEQTLIQNYNALVGKNDMVYLVGDICLGSPGATKRILEKLNGRKHLIYGNHDKVIRRKPELQEYFEWCKEQTEIVVFDKETKSNQRIFLNHYAMKTWPRKHNGSWQLYGHSHGNIPDDPDALQIDVGVDCHDYRPISYEEVKIYMEAKNVKL